MITAKNYQVEVGHAAVWVNADTGECIGRFGLYGVDVHRRIGDQGALGECLKCTHERTTAADWKIFQDAMMEHHGVDLSRLSAPSFVK